MGYYGYRKVGGTHLIFKKQLGREDKKTDRFDVINQDFGEVIGFIHWRGGWRQYVFQAEPKVDMSRSCHKEIDAFINKLMEDRKEKKKEVGDSSQE